MASFQDYTVGVPVSVPAGGTAEFLMTSRREVNLQHLCFDATWVGGTGSPTGGTVMLVPGVGPNDSTITWATEDSGVLDVVNLAAPTASQGTSQETVTICDVSLEKYRRKYTNYLKLLFTNTDASFPMNVLITGEEM